MPRGWGFSSFCRPGGRGFELSFAQAVGNSLVKQHARGFVVGGGGGHAT